MGEPIRFLPLRRNVELIRYFSRDLPHWRQEGCTYFVTFRTADSLPAAVVRSLQEERADWLKQKGMTDENLPPELLEEFASVVSRSWNNALDRSAGHCHLRDPVIAGTVAESLRFFDGKRMRLGDFVVMPNHVHALMTPFSGFSLERLLASIKGVSARKINEQLGVSGEFWQRDTYDHLVRSGDDLLRIQQYIRGNPAKAGLNREECLFGEASYLLH